MAGDPGSNLATLVQVLQFVTGVIVIPGSLALLRRLSDIRDHLAKINGHIQEINQWRADHEQAAEREFQTHETMHERCEKLHAVRLSHMEKELLQVWGRIGDRRLPNSPTD